MKLFSFFTGFFEDQTGSSSSKRAIGYLAMFYLFLIVKGSLDGKPINSEVLYLVSGIVLFSLGAITSEFFAKKGKENE